MMDGMSWHFNYKNLARGTSRACLVPLHKCTKMWCIIDQNELLGKVFSKNFVWKWQVSLSSKGWKKERVGCDIRFKNWIFGIFWKMTKLNISFPTSFEPIGILGLSQNRWMIKYQVLSRANLEPAPQKTTITTYIMKFWKNIRKAPKSGVLSLKVLGDKNQFSRVSSNALFITIVSAFSHNFIKIWRMDEKLKGKIYFRQFKAFLSQ